MWCGGKLILVSNKSKEDSEGLKDVIHMRRDYCLQKRRREIIVMDKLRPIAGDLVAK